MFLKRKKRWTNGFVLFKLFYFNYLSLAFINEYVTRNIWCNPEVRSILIKRILKNWMKVILANEHFCVLKSGEISYFFLRSVNRKHEIYFKCQLLYLKLVSAFVSGRSDYYWKIKKGNFNEPFYCIRNNWKWWKFPAFNITNFFDISWGWYYFIVERYSNDKITINFFFSGQKLMLSHQYLF